MKDKIRAITLRNRGVSLEKVILELNEKLRGWINYFRLTEWPSDLRGGRYLDTPQTEMLSAKAAQAKLADSKTLNKLTDSCTKCMAAGKIGKRMAAII